MGAPSAGKTGYTSDPRLWGKTGHRGDPRLYCAFFAKTGCFPSIGKCLGSVPRADRTGPGTRTQWQSHLARSGLRPRFFRWLSSGEALCAQASRAATPGSRRHHPHRTRRRGASRLRQWSDGARPADRQVSPDTIVRSDAGLQPEISSLLAWRSSARTWAELHEQAFRRLGGSPRVVVLDNLREGVAVPDLYDPTVNPLFRDVLAHYGVVALPCRIQDPDRKGKVESGIGHTKRTPLKGMRFESLEEAQTYLDRWEQTWADTRIHGTTKRQVAAMFVEEKPYLLPLPLEPFRYYQYGERVVHLDGCVEVEAAYYSLPPGWIGRSVKVQWDELHVRILHPSTNQLLREHLRQKRGGYRIENEDHPKKMPLSTAQLLRRAAHAGTHIGKFCQLLYERQGETSIRRILGVLSLIKKYGTAAVEDACATGLDIGVHEYRFVRRYLERRPHPQMFLRQIDPLIRELTVYRDFINLKIKEQPE